MPQTFSPGQRWISEAEPEMGLGMVEKADARQVSMVFPATETRRIYAVANAPLYRLLFDRGEQIRDQSGMLLTVLEAEEHNGVIRYQAEDESGEVHSLPEQLLHEQQAQNRPEQKLLSRRVDRDVWFTLRYQTWQQSAALWRSPAFGLSGPRIDLLPHQLYIAAEVSSMSAPRVLLADEVGLGKTIEAGLILHRLILTERVQRVLILLPDALINQWLVEMLRRFNLSFSVFDQDRFESTDADNPFETEQRVLCPLSMLSENDTAANAVLQADWDLMIVDEAHHLTWQEDEVGADYQLVDQLSQKCERVLLLTATPEQLGRAGHFGRLRLLDPQRFHSFDDFAKEEQAYQAVAQIAANLLDEQPLSATEQQQLDALLGDEADLAAEDVVDRLVDRHGTGRVLFRNTRHVIKGFPERHLNAYPLALPDVYRPFTQSITPEQQLGDGWILHDPRVNWLRDLLQELAPEKVLVICAHADTAVALKEYLYERCVIPATAFHEGMEIVARDRAAAFFADLEEGAQTLICSEIGSEGRNFQFAHHLVLFDLPVEPDLLEQRIGRLDRIGQRSRIELHVPYFESTASDALFHWYRDGLKSFAAVCPAASAVFEQLGRELQDAFSTPEKATQLISKAEQLTTQINSELEQGRDRLLEMHSYNAATAEKLLQQIHKTSDRVNLPDYMQRYWDAFGLEHEPGAGESTILRPGPHMMDDHYPGLRSDAVTLTFDRQDALAHEDHQFLSWEHPMVQGSMELLSSNDYGSTAIVVCSHPDFPTGTVFFETLFVTECLAPLGLEMQRFLPATMHRILLDTRGRDRSEALTHEQLQGVCLAQNQKLLKTIIRSQAERIKPLLAHAHELAETQSEQTVAKAGKQMRRELKAESQRLSSLAKVNPNVRQSEIDAVQQRQELLTQYLTDSRVRLDAVRIVVMK